MHKHIYKDTPLTCFHSSIDLPNDIVDHLLLQIAIHLQECVTEELQ